MSYKISVITVCRNCRNDIGPTIESVIGQDYEDIEYLIIDGLSTDGTIDIIREYASTDKRIRYVSELDTGIYDAMNKAARMATGDYLQFINAGDRLYEKDTVSKIVKFIDACNADIYYGDSVFDSFGSDGMSSSLRRYPQYCSWGIYYCLGDCINHQAIIASRRCFEDDTFDLTYKVGADRDWMIRMKKAGKKWRSIGFTVVRYRIDDDSFSVKYQDLFLEEVRVQSRQYFPIYGELIGKLIACIRKGKITSALLHFVSKRTLFRQ